MRTVVSIVQLLRKQNARKYGSAVMHRNRSATQMDENDINNWSWTMQAAVSIAQLAKNKIHESVRFSCDAQT